MTPAAFTIIGCAHCGARNRAPKDRLKDRPVCGRCGRALSLSGRYPEQPVVVSDQSLAGEVLQFPGPVVLYVYSPGCPYCQKMNPIFDHLAAEYTGRVKFTKILMEQNPQTSSRYRVDGVPTLILFRQGQVMNRIQGLQPRDEVRRHIEDLL